MIIQELRPDQLGQAFVREDARMRRVIKVALARAARRYAAYIKHRIDELGITDQGILKASVHVVVTALRTMVVADAPHAGVIEEGCRPHPVSREGRESIAGWCMRKLGLDYDSAQRASWGIANKIKKFGQKGHWIFRDSFEKAVEFYAEELAKAGKEIRS